MKKAGVKNLISTICFLALLCVVLLTVSDILEHKTSRFNKMPLYKENPSVDVILAGSSHMQDNIYPYYLWKESGITSYNIASSGERIQLTYYELKEVLKTITPKIVVVDTYFVSDSSEDDFSGMQEGLIHESMDYMRLDMDKIMLSKMAADNKDTVPMAFLSNFYAYHSRWKELDKEDFSEEFSKEKGALALVGITSYESFLVKDPQFDEKALNGAGYQYIKKIYDLCDAKGIQCVLVNMPYVNQSKEKYDREYTYMTDAVKTGHKGIFIPDYYEEIGLDLKHDYVDAGHTNICGAKKLSVFLGEYLKTECGAIDHRGDSLYKSWDNFTDDFEDALIAKIDDEEMVNSPMKMAMLFHDSLKNHVKIVTTNGNLDDFNDFSEYVEIKDLDIEKYEVASEAEIQAIKKECQDNDFDDKNIAVIVEDKESGDLVATKVFVRAEYK